MATSGKTPPQGHESDRGMLRPTRPESSSVGTSARTLVGVALHLPAPGPGASLSLPRSITPVAGARPTAGRVPTPAQGQPPLVPSFRPRSITGQTQLYGPSASVTPATRSLTPQADPVQPAGTPPSGEPAISPRSAGSPAAGVPAKPATIDTPGAGSGVAVGTGTPSDGVPLSAATSPDGSPAPAQRERDSSGPQPEEGPRGAVVSSKSLQNSSGPLTTTVAAPAASAQTAQTGMTVLMAQSYPHVLTGPAVTKEEDPSLEDIIRRLLKVLVFLRKHALLLVLLPSLGIGAGIGSFFVLPPARIAICQVTLHPEVKLNPMDPDTRRQESSMQFFAGAERAFTGDGLVKSTLVKMGFPEPDDYFVLDVANRLGFDKVGENQYVGTMKERLLERGGRSPVEFLELHLKNYVDLEIQKKLKVFVAEVDFLREQANAAEKETKDITAQIVKFREQHVDELGKTTLTPASRSQLESTRISLSGEVLRLEGELAGMRSRLRRGGHLAQARMRASQGGRDALITVNRKLAELRAQGLADTHPEVRRAMDDKQFLEKQLEEEVVAVETTQARKANPAEDALHAEIDDIESQLNAARAQRAVVAGSLKNLRQVSGDLPLLDARLDEMEQRRDETKRLHAQLYERLRKAEVQLELERVSAMSRYEITSPPRLERVGPKRTMALRGGIGVLVGLFLALAIIGVRGLRHTIRQMEPVALVLLLLLGAGCAHEKSFTWVQDFALPPEPAEPVAHPRDTLLVEVAGQQALSGEFVVREDGHYLQPVVGSVRAAGLTATQIAESLRRRLAELFTNPVVTVWLTRVAPIRVSVVGEVKIPGTQELQRERGLLSVLGTAGWVTEFARPDRVFVLRGPERVRFRLRDLTAGEPSASQFRLRDGDVVVVE
jgi:hypothetical protein